MNLSYRPSSDIQVGTTILQNLLSSFSQFPPRISLSLHGARDPVPNTLFMHLPKSRMGTLFPIGF